MVLVGADLSDDGAVASVAQALRRNKSLQQLVLGSCKMSEKGAVTLLEVRWLSLFPRKDRDWPLANLHDHARLNV